MCLVAPRLRPLYARDPAVPGCPGAWLLQWRAVVQSPPEKGPSEPSPPPGAQSGGSALTKSTLGGCHQSPPRRTSQTFLRPNNTSDRLDNERPQNLRRISWQHMIFANMGLMILPFLSEDHQGRVRVVRAPQKGISRGVPV